MAQYEVTVLCQVEETYAVEADSEEEALKNWHEGTLLTSENLNADPECAYEAEY